MPKGKREIVRRGSLGNRWMRSRTGTAGNNWENRNSHAYSSSLNISVFQNFSMLLCPSECNLFVPCIRSRYQVWRFCQFVDLFLVLLQPYHSPMKSEVNQELIKMQFRWQTPVVGVSYHTSDWSCDWDKRNRRCVWEKVSLLDHRYIFLGWNLGRSATWQVLSLIAC